MLSFPQRAQTLLTRNPVVPAQSPPQTHGGHTGQSEEQVEAGEYAEATWLTRPTYNTATAQERGNVSCSLCADLHQEAGDR
jgi:hypothetical protein